ncbi:GNAT family N-acetyltransferase [Paenibacillus caui]|uniref:GNAT family N-acetyltransferase n=1 Tax=Paenibacillus caui TaxID=2873927 RepID=UPI001CA81400|nr:GNAT family N-acetyltransferase [Paenibacillus caui]
MKATYLCRGNIPVLETPRLMLRKMEQEDAAPMFRFWSDPEVAKYMNVPPFASEDETREMINLLNALSETEDTIRWGIEIKENGSLIGSCGFNAWQLSGAYRGEIGYELGQEYWGKGYMREALQAMFEFGYETMGLNRIEALIYPQNSASIRLLAGLGFSNEGLLREYQQDGDGERFVDLYIFSLLKREFGTKGRVQG